MRNLIYYPGFEVRYVDWLKFALLYIDELRPIVPASGDSRLSRHSRMLENETDLIRVHRPAYEEGERASLDAIDVVERVLQRPEDYARTFRSSNIPEIWKRPEFHEFEVFEEKYTYSWMRFCLANGLGTQSSHGILLPKELGLVYMTLLAQVIADSKGVSPITDYSSLDRFAIFARRADQQRLERSFQVAEVIVQLQLPINLNRIPLEAIIAFRNRPDFRVQLRAFHEELDQFLENIENGSSERDFVDSYNSIWKDFVGNFVELGLGTTSFGLGAWILLNSPQVTTAEYLKDMVVGGAMLTVGSVSNIRKTWNHTRTRRYTRKYLAELRRLSPGPIRPRTRSA
jgi:hypothetical protein